MMAMISSIREFHINHFASQKHERLFASASSKTNKKFLLLFRSCFEKEKFRNFDAALETILIILQFETFSIEISLKFSWIL